MRKEALLMLSNNFVHVRVNSEKSDRKTSSIYGENEFLVQLTKKVARNVSAVNLQSRKSKI